MITGLCGQCRHARLNQTRRGPVYLRCQLASVDAAFPRYPRLPVLRCAGYQPAENPGLAQRDPDDGHPDHSDPDRQDQPDWQDGQDGQGQRPDA